jgi:hypothetical protein
VRVSAPFVPVLAEIVADAGFGDTASRLSEAMRLKAYEAPLTIEDHEAILTALGVYCPSGLESLRRELVDQQLKRRRLGL